MKNKINNLIHVDVKFTLIRWVIFILIVVVGGLIGSKTSNNPMVGGGVGGGVGGTIVYAIFYFQDRNKKQE